MMRSAMVLIVFLMLVVGGIFLQIFLSKKQNRWLGLLLPLICLLFSAIAVFNVSVFSTQGELTLTQVAEDGTVVEQTTTEHHRPPVESLGAPLSVIMTVFLIYNIPTIVLMTIYFACREKIKRRSQLEQMNIQDLE